MIEAEQRPIADRLEGVATPADCRELEGHVPILDQIVGQYKSGHMHHALLLSGPKGIGKASFAFCLAKHMFAHSQPNQGPSQFDSDSIPETVHRQVAQGGHPELLHLTRPWDEKTKKFKTQLSVEEVRRTMGFYGMTAGAGGWRISIVDAANDMNASAANALLKILEEPPKRSLFIVVAHSAGRLLPTIRSRCQMVHLNPLAPSQVASVTQRLGLQASDADRERASVLSEGSVRRAVQLIEGNFLTEYQNFEKLMADGAQGSANDWAVVHKIADTLSRRGQEDAYALFLDLVTAWIGKQVRVAGAPNLSALAGWAKVWDKANRSVTLADAYNLDKKQVILTLFGDLFERNKR